MRHAAQHSRTRTRETRQRLAFEAARLMAEGGIRDFHVAKLRAAAKLGVIDENALPRNVEIEEALREYQRLFRSEAQPQVLRKLREAALEALRFFERFDPRLVGSVLDGSADQHSPVCLHLFSDEPESVGHFLEEHGIPVDQQSRRLRLDRERSAVFAVYVFTADGTPFDLTVLPRDALRQAPLDRVDDRPMKRASLPALRELLAQTQA
ncbi:MAG: hypothetical protein ACK5PG_09695 [Lysobacterales bacterium]|jgi:hypothetical protein